MITSSVVFDKYQQILYENLNFLNFFDISNFDKYQQILYENLNFLNFFDISNFDKYQQILYENKVPFLNPYSFSLDKYQQILYENSHTIGIHVCGNLININRYCTKTVWGRKGADCYLMININRYCTKTPVCFITSSLRLF